VLSEEEKQELRELAHSVSIRDEFRLLRKLSSEHQRVDLDCYIQFLTAMSRLRPELTPPRTFVEYTNVKL
jgi:hypothetical protein